MGVAATEFQKGDVYIDDDANEVLFRYDQAGKTSYRKFYGESKETKIPNDNGLYSQAILTGKKISAKEYEDGKKPSGWFATKGK